MHHEAILYSLDPKISFSKIQELTEYDTCAYTKLQSRAHSHNIDSMSERQPSYHYKFSSIRPRVHIMYYLGDIWLLNRKILGIVGPRNMSNYSKSVLENLFTQMQHYEVVTISGMAEWVDQLCHTLSGEHKIPTIAVLGWGLWRYMTRSRRSIIDQIVADGGLVISEYKLFEQPSKYTFPQRNRLIAGLCDLLFLPEAGEKSGSLITVDCALSAGKSVYATPNSIFVPTSAGILPLIAKGVVHLVSNLSSFLAEHFFAKTPIARPSISVELTDQEKSLLALLSHDQSSSLQDIANQRWWDIQDLMCHLTTLEIKNIIYQEYPGRYRLS